jgi:hypothetical protein
VVGLPPADGFVEPNTQAKGNPSTHTRMNSAYEEVGARERRGRYVSMLPRHPRVREWQDRQGPRPCHVNAGAEAELDPVHQLVIKVQTGARQGKSMRQCACAGEQGSRSRAACACRILTEDPVVARKQGETPLLLVHAGESEGPSLQ